MKTLPLPAFLVSLLVVGPLSACVPNPAPSPPTPAPSQTPPTPTPEPTSTPTAVPSPTPLPGSVVFAVDTLAHGIPWLPMDNAARPGVSFVAFNLLRPPFDSLLVRQAFATATDRQALVEMARTYKSNDPAPATTLTPPQTLARDLYGEVGTRFDPQRARDLFIEAGYSDPSAFPAVTFLVNASGDIAPGARFNMAKAMADMWRTHLGVSVQVQAVKTYATYKDRLTTNPPELFWVGWAADYNDPDNFLREIFHSGSQYNYGRFANSDFDQRVDRAAKLTDPVVRQGLYIMAERLLCETEAALIPIFHSTYNIP